MYSPPASRATTDDCMHSPSGWPLVGPVLQLEREATSRLVGGLPSWRKTTVLIRPPIRHS
jgi:hypothetical protein